MLAASRVCDEKAATGRNQAYLDDIYVVSTPDWVGAIYAILQHELFTRVGIRVHGGKTQVWNMAGIRPEACDVLEQIAQAADPTVVVWRGSEVPSVQQGIKILGAPLGHPDFVSAHLERTIAEHAVLLERIPSDVQSAWLLLVHCAQARATNLLRALQPSLSEEFARSHDAGMCGCSCSILQLPVDQCDEVVRHTASLPLVLGGLGLRSAERTRFAALWASWADCLPMVYARHPVVAIQLALHSEGLPHTPCLSEVAAIPLSGVSLAVPTWRDSCWEHVHRPENPMITNQGPSVLGGNMRLRLGLIGISAMTCCSQHCPVRRGVSSGLKLDPRVGWHCPQLRPAC